MLKEATLLVNVTNDAWFGDSTAAHQHLQISRMRALEAGRTMLRAANDGISAIIGPDGRIASTLPRFQPGVLTGSVQPRIGLTPYARVGNWPVISVSFAVLLAAFVLRSTALAEIRRTRYAIACSVALLATRFSSPYPTVLLQHLYARSPSLCSCSESFSSPQRLPTCPRHATELQRRANNLSGERSMFKNLLIRRAVGMPWSRTRS